MTPNPQNIGVAPEEPKFHVGDRVRVLPVVRDADEECEGDYPGASPKMYELIGKEIVLEPSPEERWPLYGAGWYWLPEWLEKVPDAVGVPEAKPKGPSLPEVTQPGEGVDLEEVREAFEAADALIAHMDSCRECGDTNHRECLNGRELGADFLIKKDNALKALRRESK